MRVSIANGHGEVCVVASEGATIVSVRDAAGRELMAEGHARSGAADAAAGFETSGLQGWVDCFPGLVPEQLPVGDHEVAVADHGELWFRSWTVERAYADAVALRCRVPSLSVEARRRVSWAGSTLTVTSSYANLGPDAFSAIWASHPLFAAGSGTVIELEAAPVVVWSTNTPLLGGLDSILPPDPSGRRPWTAVGEGLAAKVFLAWPEAGVSFQTAGRGWHLGWPSSEGPGDQQALRHLGLWVNNHGYPARRPLRHLALEPTLGCGDAVAFSEERSCSVRMPPGTTLTSTLELSLC